MGHSKPTVEMVADTTTAFPPEAFAELHHA